MLPHLEVVPGFKYAAPVGDECERLSIGGPRRFRIGKDISRQCNQLLIIEIIKIDVTGTTFVSYKSDTFPVRAPRRCEDTVKI